MNIDHQIALMETELRNLQKMKRYGAGLNNRYKVTDRLDNSHVQSKNCFVLVLKPGHEADLAAMAAYADACEASNPQLAEEIRERLSNIRGDSNV
jgi:nitrogen-specific signal transduction histidine kinase